MSRRFVHMVISNAVGGRAGFTLHSIAASTLFHPPKATPAATTMEDAELPTPAMSFYLPWLGSQPGWMEFMPLAGGGVSTSQMNDYVVGADHRGHTVLCDAAARAVLAMPALHAPKAFPVSLVAGDTLYVMSRNPQDPECFEALVHGYRPGSIGPRDFGWYPLPPPVFVHEDPPAAAAAGLEEEDDYDDCQVVEPCVVDAYAVFDDAHLWYSTHGAGTHCFDIAKNMWSMVGEWKLPFRGRAVHDAGLGLWFGFSSDHDDRFCACDLAAAAAAGGRRTKSKPPLRKVWEDAVAAPQDCELIGSYLVPLGSGSFCIARIFQHVLDQEWHITGDSFGVLTGVEVVGGAAAGLDMIPHKSVRYGLANSYVKNVF
ncbi:hypothetical protein ACP70R_042136 [Stipagrostis hirtigluma subsp. patula]